MTSYAIADLPSGDGLDKLISIYLFDDRSMKRYSSNIRDAFEIVEKFENDPLEILFKLVRKGFDHKSLIWSVEFRQIKGEQKYYYAEADTIPLAICRAAAAVVIDTRNVR